MIIIHLIDVSFLTIFYIFARKAGKLSHKSTCGGGAVFLFLHFDQLIAQHCWFSFPFVDKFLEEQKHTKKFCATKIFCDLY